MTIRSAWIASALLLAGCVASPPVSVPKAPCSSLLPEAWDEPVKVPDTVDYETVGELAKAVDILTGLIGVQFDRYISGKGIVQRCERRDLEATQPPRKRWLAF